MPHHSPPPDPTPPSPQPAGGLAALREVKLRREFVQMLDEARAMAGGPSFWRLRKVAELRDLLALAEISGRLAVKWFDASTDLRVVVAMRAPVPLRGPQPNAQLVIAPLAILGLTYRLEVLYAPQPGYSFVQLLEPLGSWHPNITRLEPNDPRAKHESQVVCLGAQLPIGFPLREIVLMSFAALQLRSVQFSVSDAAGVANAASALWWQQNSARIPLSRDPFILNPANRQ